MWWLKDTSVLCQFDETGDSKTLSIMLFDKSDDLMTLFHYARLTKWWLKCTSVLCQYDKMVTKRPICIISVWQRIVTQRHFCIMPVREKWCLKRLCIMPGWEKWWLKDTSALSQFDKSGDSSMLLHYSSLVKVVIQGHTCIYIMPVWQKW